MDLLKYGLNNSYSALSDYINRQDCTTQILDPLTVMLRLSLLTFKPEGTKISISNHTIHYDKPGPFQGTTRWVRGDKRTDLHNLRNPIQKATEWFDSNEHEHIKQIFIFAKHGLKSLREVYAKEENNTSAMVCHCLNHYVQLIDRSLNQKLATESYVQAKSKSREEDGYRQLRELWSNEEIQIATELLQLSINRRREKKEYQGYVRSLETLLDEKDKSTYKTISAFIKTLQ